MPVVLGPLVALVVGVVVLGVVLGPGSFFLTSALQIRFTVPSKQSQYMIPLTTHHALCISALMHNSGESGLLVTVSANSSSVIGSSESAYVPHDDFGGISSFWQSSLHPSPLMVFPSSHSSPSSTIQLLHTGPVHFCSQLTPLMICV
jgi:hypothetical protein